MSIALACLAAVALAVACVVVHWGVMELLVRRLCTQRHNLSRRLLAGVLVLLAAHCVQISGFAIGYELLDGFAGASFERGGRGGERGEARGFLEAWYFSASVYTTVGFGDITPRGPLRLLAGLEALVGLLMITWSASFTFLVMNRAWIHRYGGERPL